jgi:hypothetical protein
LSILFSTTPEILCFTNDEPCVAASVKKRIVSTVQYFLTQFTEMHINSHYTKLFLLCLQLFISYHSWLKNILHNQLLFSFSDKFDAMKVTYVYWFITQFFGILHWRFVIPSQQFVWVLCWGHWMYRFIKKWFQDNPQQLVGLTEVNEQIVHRYRQKALLCMDI